MRVLHLYKTYYPDTVGGIETFIEQLILGGLVRGIQADILTVSPSFKKEKIERKGYIIHRALTTFSIASCPFSWQALAQFSELLKTTDLVHYHFPWPFADCLHFIKCVKKPSIVTYHSDVIKQNFLLKLYRPLMLSFLSSVDRIIATSPSYMESSSVLKQLSDKTSVIPIGLDQATYPNASHECIAAWIARFSQPFLLFVGSLRYYKGLEFLIEAAQNIRAPIVILGSGLHLEQSLRSQVKSLAMNNIHFLGELHEEDKIALLTLCYALVFPSHLRSEAFGISLLEGAMFGKPLISCEIGTGTTYINIARETGLVVPPGDPSALREAMQFLLDHPQEAERMGKNAAKRYQAMFRADQMVESYVNIYQDVLGRI